MKRVWLYMSGRCCPPAASNFQQGMAFRSVAGEWVALQFEVPLTCRILSQHQLTNMTSSTFAPLREVAASDALQSITSRTPQLCKQKSSVQQDCNVHRPWPTAQMTCDKVAACQLTLLSLL